jgi:sugar O-acyltransferase (sialic acid O-acetyltransferase NeuD family)
MQEIVVVGGGGHAKVVLSILKKLESFNVLGYSDLKDNGTLLGTPYLGSDRDLSSFAGAGAGLNAVIAVGQVGLGTLRHELWARMQRIGLTFPEIVSPQATVNEEVVVGEGVVVMDGAVINPGSKIGRGAIVNTNSTVEHDVILEEWVHVAPGATISGGVKVGRFSMIGVGATVLEGVNIAANSIVGAGATVVHDLSEPGVYVGCPARRIR